MQSIAPGQTQLEIAQQANLDKSHPTRWKQGYTPSVVHVVQLARSYGRSPLEALVAAGIIAPEEADLRDVVRPLEAAQLTNDELVGELRRRLP